MSDVKKKIYLQGIPVYRTANIEEDEVKYVLFEDNETISHVLYIRSDASMEEEYTIVLEQIRNLVNPPNDGKTEMQITVLTQEYEQSKRDKQWLQKPTAIQTGAIIKA